MPLPPVDAPLVSVVIPTRNRPALVVRAVDSALAQTERAIEVIVVVDGPDPATRDALAAIGDRRLRVVHRPASGGASAARNTGVDHARAPWVAFLDDDDIWLPRKLEAQLAEAARSSAPLQLISCRTIARTPHRDYDWPRRFPAPGEHLSEYLFRRRSPAQGDGGILTPTIMVSRAVFAHARFDTALTVHEDWEWMLRAVTLTGMRVAIAPEVLAIAHVEDQRPRLSGHGDWRFSMRWARDRLRLGHLTRDAYASFVLTRVATKVPGWRQPMLLLAMLADACRHGRPNRFDLLTFAGALTAPGELRRRLRVRLEELRRRAAPEAGRVIVGAR